MKRLGLPSVAPLCFFLISVSYKLAWTAISSLLSQYSKEYGPDILLRLNVAYFFPSIPVLMLQTAFNDRMDRRLGLPLGALVRFGAGLGGLVYLTGHFPALTAGSERALLATTVAVGIAYGLAFGTSYQIASKYPSGATVALTTGFVSCGLVILGLDLRLKDGPFYTPEGLAALFRWVAIVTSVGLASAVLLVLGSWRMLSAGGPVAAGSGKPLVTANGHGHVHGKADSQWYGVRSSSVRHSMRHRVDAPHSHVPGSHAITLDFDHLHSHGSHHHAVHADGTANGSASYGHGQGGSHGGPPYDVDGHAPGHGSGGTGGHTHNGMSNGSGDYRGVMVSGDESKVSKELPFWRLAARIFPAAASIAISVGTSMLIFPFFTYMHSTGLMGVRLPQVLFYIRLIGDIVGRMVPKKLQVTTVRGLVFWAAVKLAMVPLLFGCIFTPHLTGGDISSALVVGLFWVLSGYLNTCSYLVAPLLVPPSQKPRASVLMTVAFQSSCFGALLIAYFIQQGMYGPQGAVGAGVTH